MRVVLLASLVLVHVSALAIEIDVGGKHLAVPSPPGYAAVTPDMLLVSEALAHFVPSHNEQFAAFIPEAAVPTALKGTIPNLTRRFIVQVPKRVVRATISSSQFQEMTLPMKTEFDAAMAKLVGLIPGLNRESSRRIAERFAFDPALSTLQVIPLAPHSTSENILALSMLSRVRATNSSGTTTSMIVASTITFLHVGGKVLCLYAYAGQDGLEWTRTMSANWAKSVLHANRSTHLRTTNP